MHFIEDAISQAEKQSVIFKMVKGSSPPRVKLEAIVQPQKQQAGKPDFATGLNNEDQCLAINLRNCIIHIPFFV